MTAAQVTGYDPRPMSIDPVPLRRCSITRNTLDACPIADAGLTYLGNGTPGGF